MKDIGSIFPIYSKDLDQGNSSICLSKKIDNQILYSLCRETLYDIAKCNSSGTKRVLLPAYTCQTVIDPFQQLGWNISYYSIGRDLRIDINSLLDLTNQIKPDIVLAHPYYGMDFDDSEQNALKQVKDKGVIIIIDNTQCIFSDVRLSFVDYYVGSYRKWFGCPDGAFLENYNKGVQFQTSFSDENDEFVQKQTDAMYLRGEYFLHSDEMVKQISIRLNKNAVKGIAGEITPHEMASFSKAMFAIEDVNFNISQRTINYKILFQGLKSCSKCTLVCEDLARVTTAPLYFPIYVDDRPALQKELALQHIYAPVLWPVCTKDVLINSIIEFMFDHLLAIPCDQRYDEKDMKKIISVINGLADE